MSRRLLELVVWSLVLFALELLLVSSVDRAEVVLAAPLAVVAAGLTVAAHATASATQRVPAATLRWLVRLPLSVLRDSGAVWLAAARRRRGTWRELPITGAVGDEPGAAGVRAVASLVLSASPASVCVDVDPQRGTALLHDLGGSAGSSLERAVRR